MIVQVDKFSRGRPGVYAAPTGSIRLESLFLTLPTRALTGRMSLCRSRRSRIAVIRRALLIELYSSAGTTHGSPGGSELSSFITVHQPREAYSDRAGHGVS